MFTWRTNMGYETVTGLFGKNISHLLRNLPEADRVEEIRVRVNRKVEVISGSSRKLLPATMDRQAIHGLLQNAAGQSLYAYEDQLKAGYLTIAGGHRIGVSGRVLTENGRIVSIDFFSSLNIRIARALPGVAKNLIHYVHTGTAVHSSLIVSPPGTGKTTLLRDMARMLSDGGKKVCVVDERGEIACCKEGIPTLDVGERTDVLDGAAKAEGLRMSIRSMSPEVVVTDEIATSDDLSAVAQASAWGVAVLASAHAATLQELLWRPSMRDIIEEKLFNRILFIERSGALLRAKHAYNADLKEISYA